MKLTGKQRRHLRALAHHLEPVVQVGHKGLSDAVIRQIDDALETHELIKCRFGKECPDPPAEAALTIEERLGASVVQSVGRVLVVYRGREKEPTIVLPGA